MGRLKFRILGCGASTGVPWINGYWGRCDPANSKNRRSRCSLLVERQTGDGVTRLLVDSGPDMRDQLIAAQVDALDGVVYTHPHADHVHGIDDLRCFFIASRKLVDVYSDDETNARLLAGFGYCFAEAASGYPPIAQRFRICAGEPFQVDGAGGPIEVLPFKQHHGDISSLGLRIGGVAYSSDISGVPPESESLLAGLDVWIVDALRHRPHPTHFSVEQAVDWIARIKPERAILTHMTVELDYAELKASLPEGVEPAFDGYEFEADG